MQTHGTTGTWLLSQYSKGGSLGPGYTGTLKPCSLRRKKINAKICYLVRADKEHVTDVNVM